MGRTPNIWQAPKLAGGCNGGVTQRDPLSLTFVNDDDDDDIGINSYCYCCCCWKKVHVSDGAPSGEWDLNVASVW